MKNKILIFLSTSLLLLSACKKEEPISENITGHVYEMGTGNPVNGADVFLIAQRSGIWAGAEVMAQTKTDRNGAFTIKNAQHKDIVFHYLVAQAFDYYELNSTTDPDKYTVVPATSGMDISLYRKANLKVRLVNMGTGEGYVVRSPRQVLNWTKYQFKDTTLNLKVDGFVNNKITHSPNTNGIIVTRDTTVYIIPGNQDTLLLKY